MMAAFPQGGGMSVDRAQSRSGAKEIVEDAPHQKRKTRSIANRSQKAGQNCEYPFLAAQPEVARMTIAKNVHQIPGLRGVPSSNPLDLDTNFFQSGPGFGDLKRRAAMCKTKRLLVID